MKLEAKDRLEAAKPAKPNLISCLAQAKLKTSAAIAELRQFQSACQDHQKEMARREIARLEDVMRGIDNLTDGV